MLDSASPWCGHSLIDDGDRQDLSPYAVSRVSLVVDITGHDHRDLVLFSKSDKKNV